MLTATVLCLFAVPASQADGIRSSATSSIPMSAGVALGTYSAPSNHSLMVAREVLREVGEVDAQGAECSYTRHRALVGLGC